MRKEEKGKVQKNFKKHAYPSKSVIKRGASRKKGMLSSCKYPFLGGKSPKCPKNIFFVFQWFKWY